MLVGGRQKGRAGGSHNGYLSINLSPLPYKWWVGGRGRTCGDRKHPPHVPIWGSTSPPPSFQPCLSMLNQLQHPPASNSAEKRYHPLFRALKRLQGPALLTRGDMVPVPASPVCPLPHGLLPRQRQPSSFPAPAGCWVPATERQGGTAPWGVEPLERIPCLWHL